MSYISFVVATPYSWIVACGLLTGIAVGGLTRVVIPRLRAGDGEDRSGRRAARASQLTRVIFYLAAAVACIPAAVFLPGADRILDPELPRFFIGAGAAGFLAERFPRALGIPVVFLVLIAVVIGLGVLAPYKPAFGRTAVAELRALSVHQDTVRVELLAPEDPELALAIVTLSGNAVAPVITTVELHPGWFVFGREAAYRIRGLDAFAGEDEPGLRDSFRVDDPAGWHGVAVRLLRAGAGRLPGITKSESVGAPQRIRALERYAVVLDTADGAVELIRRD